MKNFLIILILSLIAFMTVGCSNDDYASSSNWSVSDEEFVDKYFQYYMTNISYLAKKNNIYLDKKVDYIDDKGYLISYKNDEILIEFYFYNDTARFGNFRSYYYYFNENIENLFDYSKHEIIISFISDVNLFVSFDYQGGKKTYHELYLSNLTHGKNTYYYHNDSVVGSIGYLVSWGNNYSEYETRWYISFKFHSLLKSIEN